LDRQQVSPKPEEDEEDEYDDEYERSFSTTTNHVMSMQNLLITDSPTPPPMQLESSFLPRPIRLPAPHALEPSLITPSNHYYTATSSTSSLPNPLSDSPQNYNLPALIGPSSPKYSYYHLNYHHLNRENSP
jgi:hypothetical protein